ncbi:lipoyl synthase, mitochondrial [Plakobranchus ocellatus]|uniref:Lipoyl synthase, mitochondrial n=1 Tax=Plakobranchus ocellatus TaxID=259542 RepID=A0AAV3ZAP7_9GAST|nr:lipoyl synthase, mitochondrial [Plakobranchus ocellatus]
MVDKTIVHQTAAIQRVPKRVQTHPHALLRVMQRQYASLTKDQKEKLAEGPSLEDFIAGNDQLKGYDGEEGIKRVKGEQ